MIYNVQSEFIQIGVTSGTIQNNSFCPIEISNQAVADSGVLLYPLNKVSFYDTTLYMRCVDDGAWAEIRVVPFVVDGGGVIVTGGGGSSGGQTVPEDQVATDEDIQSLIDDIFG